MMTGKKKYECPHFTKLAVGAYRIRPKTSTWIMRIFNKRNIEAVLNLSPKAHTKTNTSSQEKLFGEIQNSF